MSIANDRVALHGYGASLGLWPEQRWIAIDAVDDAVAGEREHRSKIVAQKAAHAFANRIAALDIEMLSPDARDALFDEAVHVVAWIRLAPGSPGMSRGDLARWRVALIAYRLMMIKVATEAVAVAEA